MIQHRTQHLFNSLFSGLFAVIILVLQPAGFSPAQDPAGASQTAAKQEDDKQADEKDSAAAIADHVGITYANPVRARWKIGVRVVGASRSARNMLITIPVPTDWPEQQVSMVSEEIPTEIGDVKFRNLESGIKQLVMTMPLVRAREETIATMTFLVTTSQIEAPADPSLFLRPKSNHRAGKPYVGVGPRINFRNSKLRNQVKELVADKSCVWEEVEAIFDWVRDSIEQRDVEPSDTNQVFRAKSGSPEDRVALFVAMCRAHKIPARMVWVEGTQYAEFMLVDPDKNPHWFPCNVLGIREFGSMSDPRIILQKGDSIRVPEKEDRQLYVAEFAMCQGKVKPGLKFIRELLPADE
jgi:hypothetical protein